GGEPWLMGYCWRTPKYRNGCAQHAFLEGKKAEETSPRKSPLRTLKEVGQQYLRVKRDTGKGGRRRARRLKCAAVPPEQAGFLSPMSIQLYLSVYPLPSPVPKTSCIFVPMICANCILDLQGTIHGLLLSYLLHILKTSSSPLMKVSAFSTITKKIKS